MLLVPLRTRLSNHGQDYACFPSFCTAFDLHVPLIFFDTFLKPWARCSDRSQLRRGTLAGVFGHDSKRAAE